MSFKIETHLHTSESSACGGITAAMHAELRKKEGYDAIIVTDHFFRGNCAINRDLPWEEFVNQFCLGYEHAKAKGDEIGLKVFFGWEESFGQGAEMLVYGLDKEFLLAHPDMKAWSAKENYERVHEAGGFVVQAHPFRQRWYNDGIHLYPYYCDAVEAINMCNEPMENTRGKAYANSYELPMTEGSDIHHADTIGGGMLFEQELNSINDYIELVKKGTDYKLLHFDKF